MIEIDKEFGLGQISVVVRCSVEIIPARIGTSTHDTIRTQWHPKEHGHEVKVLGSIRSMASVLVKGKMSSAASTAGKADGIAVLSEKRAKSWRSPVLILMNKLVRSLWDRKLRDW